MGVIAIGGNRGGGANSNATVTFNISSELSLSWSEGDSNPLPVTYHDWEGREKSRAGNPSQATISGTNGTLPARLSIHPTPSVLIKSALVSQATVGHED